LNRKAVNNIVDPLKAETTSSTDPQIKKVFNGLFNLIEVLASENEKLTAENQQLKNKINVLKGKPDVKPNNRNKKKSRLKRNVKMIRLSPKARMIKTAKLKTPKRGSAIESLSCLTLTLTERKKARLINLSCRQMLSIKAPLTPPFRILRWSLIMSGIAVKSTTHLLWGKPL
jgi:uncharacterized protein YdgA (DUF945 family)